MLNFNQIFYRLCVFSTIIVLTSCEDYFELERPPEEPWLTVGEFERAPIGAYGVLFSSQEWVQSWPNYSVVINSMGDDVEWVNDPQWGYWRNTAQGSDRTDLSDRNIWLVYRGIGAVNNALDFVAANDGKPYGNLSETDEANFTRIVGELHFIRGFCYYMLQTTFGHAYVPGGNNSLPDLPLRTSFVKNAEDGVTPKTGTTQEMWDFIRDEFILAKELLPNYFDASLHDASYEVRANKYAAAAMLMRTYFQRGEYSNAENEAGFIIDQNGGLYDLSEDPIEAFSKSGYAERGRETIFYIPFSDQTLYPPNHLSVLNATWNGGKTIWNETRMAEEVIKRLDWMDDPTTETTFKVAALRDKRFQQLIKVRYPIGSASPDQETDDRSEISGITTVWPWKYYRGPAQDFTNVPLIRLAEVLLTRSIIRFNEGNLAGAANDLNIVKQRAWDEVAAGESFSPITAATITAEMIHDERVIELFNEADRLNYLRGLKMDVPKGARGEGSDPYTSEIFVWPVPQSEALYNDNLNPGGQ